VAFLEKIESGLGDADMRLDAYYNTGEACIEGGYAFADFGCATIT